MKARILAGAIVCWLAIGTAQAQGDRSGRAGIDAVMDNIDLLIDNYGRFLGKKYELDAEQLDYTGKLLRDRAHQFLDKHEDEVRNLVGEMFEARINGGADMTQDDVTAWGRRAAPLFNEAKKIIIEGNADWREILTDEQKRMHDEDLALMHESFETTQGQIDAMVTGDMTVDEFAKVSTNRPRSRGARTAKANQNPAPKVYTPTDIEQKQNGVDPDADFAKAEESGFGAEDGKIVKEAPIDRTPKRRHASPEAEIVKGNDGSKSPEVNPQPPGRSPHEPRSNAATAVRSKTATRQESDWERYTREFCEKYELNDEQRQRAQSILTDCEKQRDRYLEKKKATLEDLDKRIAELRQSKDKDAGTQVTTLTQQKTDLEAPVQRIFDRQLKPRLERLPTSAQRKAAETKVADKGSKDKKAAPKRR
ncbi:MAG: hypothetical protein KDA32_03385 [Phycisphaerales bacterium]|nr:hypothetical protein [Phycisphaerales bacterium]